MTGQAGAGRQGSALEVLRVFLWLGLTAFGGPVAHLGYFRNEFVARRGWISERDYADLVALCQFLPGPTSSQVGMAIGQARAGWIGAAAAWTGFTAPSAILLAGFATGLSAWPGVASGGWLHGLKAAAVAIVALAILGMARSLAPDRERATLAIFAAAIALALPSTAGQLAAIGLGVVWGAARLRAIAAAPDEAGAVTANRAGRAARVAAVCALFAFAGLLVVLPLAAAWAHDPTLTMVEVFYRAGALVFGGGHVVLPLLQSALVPQGLIGADAFLAGYGAAQAVPGPLFTFAAYLGAVTGGWSGALVCLLAIFAPSFLLLVAIAPLRDGLRRAPFAQAMLAGVNAAVVGLLLAAFYDPVWKAGILSAKDYALALGAFVALFLWRAPPWLVVLACAVAGAVI